MHAHKKVYRTMPEIIVKSIKNLFFYIDHMMYATLVYCALTFHQLGHLTWPTLKALMTELGATEARVIGLLDALMVITPIGQQIEQWQYDQQAEHQPANAATANVTHTHHVGISTRILFE